MESLALRIVDDPDNFLSHLGLTASSKLLICGDFNEICEDTEKLGGRPRLNSQMSQFNSIIKLLGLYDLGFVGYPFTWLRANGLCGRVDERLDRALASTGCFENIFLCSRHSFAFPPFLFNFINTTSLSVKLNYCDLKNAG